MTRPQALRGAWLGLLLCGLLPFAHLCLQAWVSYAGSGVGLGANPVEAVTHRSGAWALYLLLATLAITPLRRALRLGWLVRFRRLLGLLAFFYACLHVATYIVDRAYVEAAVDLRSIGADIAKRPYITLGVAAFLPLLPLAITSTHGMIRRLGRRWQTLHRAIYASAILGVLHFTWLVKADLRGPVISATLLLALMAARIVFWSRELHHTLPRAAHDSDDGDAEKGAPRDSPDAAPHNRR